MIQTIGQCIGFVALIVSIAVFQRKKRKAILLTQMTSSCLFAMHYLLLGAPTGVTMNLLGATRNFIFSKKDKWIWTNNFFVLYLFISIFIIGGLITWQGYISILPMIGMTAGTISFWMNSPRKIRLISLIPSPFWFTYNFLSHSYPGMIGDMVCITSIVIGIIRFDIIKKDEELAIS